MNNWNKIKDKLNPEPIVDEFIKHDASLPEILLAIANYLTIDEKEVISRMVNLIDGEESTKILVMSQLEFYTCMDHAKEMGKKSKSKIISLKDA